MNNPAKFCFGGSLILPVTPSVFDVGAGIRIETVNIHSLGDLRIAGYSTLDDITLDSFFPAQKYPFRMTDDVQPYALVARFKAWAAARQPIRFLITGTDVNLPVLVEQIRYSERDGSGDVYYSLKLSEYRAVSLEIGIGVSVGSSRPVDSYMSAPSTKSTATSAKSALVLSGVKK